MIGARRPYPKTTNPGQIALLHFRNFMKMASLQLIAGSQGHDLANIPANPF